MQDDELIPPRLIRNAAERHIRLSLEFVEYPHWVALRIRDETGATVHDALLDRCEIEKVYAELGLPEDRH